MLRENLSSPAFAALLALLLTAAAAPTGDQLTKPSLQRAHSLVREELRYSEAIPLLRQALRDPAITAEERALACELLGLAYLAQGDAARAGAVLWELFRLVPDHAVAPELSPKIQTALAEARARAQAAPRFEELAAVLHDDGAVIQGRLSGAGAEIAQTLLHLHQADGRQRSLPATLDGGLLRAELSLEAWRALGPQPLCHLTAQDLNGEVVAQLGTLDAPVPLTIRRVASATPVVKDEPVAAAATQPEEDSTIFWVVGATGAALLLAGATAITLWLVLGASEPAPEPVERPTGTLAPIELD